MLNKDIKINDVQIWMDGGSITIKCSDSDNNDYTMGVQQHMILKTSPNGKMPGRIYLNNKLVEERSDMEKAILSNLEKAMTSIQSSIQTDDKIIIQEEINYIRSEQYIINNKTIEAQRLQLIGREFDWLAIDIDGKYGLFSSAGSGVIPMNVIEDYNNHDNITEQMTLPNNGYEKVWDDFSSYGFYVYDWELNNGPYIRKSKPNSEIPKKISADLSKLRSLIKLDFSFEDVKEIIIE